ncbi:SIR2 family protein [Caenimonas soli]|uniref:SIR2 family protein n=1 Tax=Caenimonas soli TaxID=2735555 RepID=UPI0015557D4E|nr:SIR2 family protein [Caenimonas soli]NPC57826.1 SIR2 family protein [Caenimonas soli]
MQILTSATGTKWLKAAPPAGDKPDPADAEARHVLSDVFRCNNLVVLAGLGTSLCLKDAAGKTLAPTMWELWQRVSAPYVGAGTFVRLLGLVRQPDNDTNLEALLSRCKIAQDFLDGADKDLVTGFVQSAETLIYAAVDFIKPGQTVPAHLEFLRRAARRSNRRSRTKLFTTNYDRCFEEAGRQGRYVIVDGFSQTQPPTFDAVYFSYDIVRRDRETDSSDFIQSVFHLYKLHGSIDWEQDASSAEIRKVAKPVNPLLIYPRSTKYELAFAQPYLEMMSALQAALRDPNTGLLVVGFGFNDNHLAGPILSAIRTNLALKACIVSPLLAPGKRDDGTDYAGEASTNTHLVTIKSLISAGDARLSLLNGTFEDAVALMPDIVAESDLEKHLERVRNLEKS